MGHIVHHQLIKDVWGHLIMKASNSVNYKQQIQALLISWLILWDLMSCHRSQIFFETCDKTLNPTAPTMILKGLELVVYS